MTTHDTGQDPRLHPQAAAVLAARGARSLTTMSVDEARATHAAGSAARPPGPAPAELVDLAIAGVPVRRYRPAAPSGAAVVYFHGGGWVLGSLETHDQQCRLLCQGTSATVISVDYRLAPEHHFPAAVDDAVAVTAAVLAGDAGGGIGDGGNGGDGGIDPTRVAVAGDSAGGNLAAAVTIALRDAGGPRPAAQLLVYPALDAAMTAPSYHEPHDGLFLTGDEMAWFYDRYAPGVPPGDWRLSPLRADDLSGLPPALVVTAEHDPLRDEGEAYAQRLAEAGVEATAVRYVGVSHGFFGWSHAVAPSRALIEQASHWLRTRLGGPGPSSTG